jgi:hypothetical protein
VRFHAFEVFIMNGGCHLNLDDLIFSKAAGTETLIFTATSSTPIDLSKYAENNNFNKISIVEKCPDLASVNPWTTTGATWNAATGELTVTATHEAVPDGAVGCSAPANDSGTSAQDDASLTGVGGDLEINFMEIQIGDSNCLQEYHILYQ